jgi:hypothetical protein
MLVKTNVLDPVFVLRRSSQQERRFVLECGGLTPLSFCVSLAFCEIAVGGAERKKGTAKAASSHRTAKKANRPVGNKNRYVPEVQNWAETVQTEHARPALFFYALERNAFRGTNQETE